MCGRWYLPIFLCRDGSLTLMNRASLIALVRFWSSLPIIVKFSTINKNIYMVVPYQQGLSERVKNTCQKYGVQVHFKGGQTIKDLLMAPKDKDPITNKSGIIYRYKCSEDRCEEEYIG